MKWGPLHLGSAGSKLNVSRKIRHLDALLAQGLQERRGGYRRDALACQHEPLQDLLASGFGVLGSKV